MRKIKFNNQMIRKRAIVATPSYINVEGIKVGDCTKNSKIVIENNPTYDIKYIEGALILKENGKLKSQPHAWCKIEDLYFDPTVELLENENPIGKDLSRFYFPYNEIEYKNIPEQLGWTIPFSDDSNDFLVYCKQNFPLNE